GVARVSGNCKWHMQIPPTALLPAGVAAHAAATPAAIQQRPSPAHPPQPRQLTPGSAPRRRSQTPALRTGLAAPRARPAEAHGGEAGEAAVALQAGGGPRS